MKSPPEGGAQRGTRASPMGPEGIDRRAFLVGGFGLALGGVAGCGEDTGDDDGAPDPDDWTAAVPVTGLLRDVWREPRVSIYPEPETVSLALASPLAMRLLKDSVALQRSTPRSSSLGISWAGQCSKHFRARGRER